MNNNTKESEVYFFGQIVGATSEVDRDGLFVEALFEAGKEWESIPEHKLIVTQTGYPNDDNFICFDQPFELKYKTHNYYGWPKIVVKVWKLDSSNTIDFFSYGTMFLPNTKGFHELSFDTFCLHGQEIDETFAFFLDGKPILPSHEPISKDLDYRIGMVSKPGPRIHFNVEVVFRNFDKENKRNLANKEI